MIPILAEFGPIKLYSYGLMMALGFWVGAQIGSREYARRGGDADEFWRLALYCFVASLVTSHLWWWAREAAAGRAGRAELLSGSGHVWFAGMIGGLLTAFLLSRGRGIDPLKLLDGGALGTPLGHALGRIGCHLAGDGDWGQITAAPWGVAYVNAIAGWHYPAGVTVHPTSLYEAGAYALVFALLFALRRRAGRGMLLGSFLVLTSVARFVIELWRINPPVALGLSEAQWIAIGLSAAGAALWLRGRKAQRDKPATRPGAA